MRNTLFNWSTRTIKRGVGVASSLALVALLLASTGLWASKDGFQSVEFDLAELSPNGEMGGYAVPASGESPAPLQVSYVCKSDGSNITLTVAFTYSSYSNHSLTLYINGTNYGPLGSGATSVTSGSLTTYTRTFDFPASGSYTVRVSGYTGTGSEDDPVRSYSYSATAGPIDCEDGANEPSVDLKVRNNTTGSGWVDGPITINTTDDLDLSWTSNNVVSCAGSKFSVPGNAVSGTQTTVSNPGAGSTRTYTIVCGSDSSGAVSDSVRVTAIAGTGQPPTLTGDPIYVLKGGNTGLTWNTNGNDPASCTLTGPGVNLSPVSGNTGTHTVTVYGESTYTIQCPGGSDSVTIHVLPVIQET